MLRLFVCLIFLCIIVQNLRSEQMPINQVISYTKGILPDSLSNNESFPNNIFGLPSRRATLTIPENSLEEVEPIGFGGEIIVGFKGKIIKDGPGNDFVIFENVFKNPVNSGLFVEPAIVSVSIDGINFVEFPFDNFTLSGLAGLTPTFGDKDPYDPNESGGDGYDLATIGMSFIKYIKIKDTTKLVTYLPKNHKYYNPEFILSGFDLDAVLGYYVEDDISSISEPEIIAKHLTFQNDIIQVNNSEVELLKVYDLNGNEIKIEKLNNYSYSLNNLTAGIYFINIYIHREVYFFKFCKT